MTSGRLPTSGVSRLKVMSIRVSEDELARWKECAAKHDTKIQDWVRITLNHFSTQILSGENQLPPPSATPQ